MSKKVLLGTIESAFGPVHYAVSDLGAVAITTPGQGLTDLEIILHKRGVSLEARLEDAHDLHGVQRQLCEYFAGDRTCFTFPLDYTGTPFQLAVWKALLDIPYGDTRTYGDIARAIGNPRASRAVGQANHVNPLALVIP